MTARYVVGDVLDVLRAMPSASVDLVLSSPPFLALRAYLPADHPDKAKEMGSEPTPGAYIDALLDVVEECRRVLTPHGSLCFELGDTYSGSGGAGGDYNAAGLREGQPKFRAGYLRNDRDGRQPQEAPKAAGKPKNNRFSQPDAGPRTGPGRTTADGRPGWPNSKSLCLIPELLRVAMVYGFNPLTGRETPRWRARNVVRWHRPNPPVGALGDKFRPSTSDMLVACVSGKRYFDLDAVRGPIHDTTGAPPLDTWVIPTEPYKGSHYATWPTDLLIKPILSMCPARVCTTCGKPSERITVAANGYADKLGTSWADKSEGRGKAAGGARSNHAGQPIGSPHIKSAEYVTTGWTDCGCSGEDRWRKGVVLDPFGGSGTTAVVALGHGRDAILIDLDGRNADLARGRVGMWLEVEHHVEKEPA